MAFVKSNWLICLATWLLSWHLVLAEHVREASMDSQALTSCPIDWDKGDLRDSFPDDFIWGAGTSAPQVEGAAELDGRTPSGWDLLAKIPGKVVDGSNTSITCDSYHRYLEDVELVEAMGADSYRISISWSRLLPHGGSMLNPKGVAYYNKLIDALVLRGIRPLVTLYHHDMPAELIELGGWLNRTIIDKFAFYADACFSLFGDRVDTWATLNEPYDAALMGYTNGAWPPSRCSDRLLCEAGDSDVEPYQALHIMLLAHAAAVEVYREKYNKNKRGRISITMEGPYWYPHNKQNETLQAQERAFAWRFNWAWHPLAFGDYPEELKEFLGSRLPTFTATEKRRLKGSYDYLSLNFYTGEYVMQPWVAPAGGYDAQAEVDGRYRGTFFDEAGNSIGPSTGLAFRPMVPKAIYDMLMWLTATYPDVPILISENGMSHKNEPGPDEKKLCDVDRVSFFREYLKEVGMAIRDGALVQGYYVWSLLDSFEFSHGFTVLHGIVHVDFNDANRTRTPRASFLWWADFLRQRISTVIDA
eukprot:TRINITY_DN21982_c0_g1_i1.p1 TRINITY_DN21982_c0_g1~~TRINITY_DN21982_c0_g1_i1.p1  ORF type:complete len:530 (+),score=29.99 TRINITY_DN21982_c0_g1_i1:512-2101(+)